MSKTDRTDPLWVQQLRDGQLVHDHTRGICLPEDDRRRWRTLTRHWYRCPRRVLTAIECPVTGCWYAYRAQREAAAAGLPDPGGCGRVHSRSHYDLSIPCATCDTPVPTCTYELGSYGAVRDALGLNPPAWWRKHRTHAPMRGERRRAGRLALKEYNAGVRAGEDCAHTWHDTGCGCAKVEDDWEPRTTHPRAGWWD